MDSYTRKSGWGAAPKNVPCGADVEYTVIIETEFQNTNYGRGISPNDMPRHLSQSSERNLGRRTPYPVGRPILQPHSTRYSTQVLDYSIATQKVNSSHAILPFDYLYWRTRIQGPWVDLCHDGKFETYLEKNLLPHSSEGASSPRERLKITIKK